ncbi:hypothetical protein V8D89_006139 [Ganoderma adspersum]
MSRAPGGQSPPHPTVLFTRKQLGKHGPCAVVVSTPLLTVPVELRMLTSLKELYLFDNHLQTLPPELGTLHQLQMLRVHGSRLLITRTT